jgi:Protein of unknown function (DUF2480)
MEEIVNKVATSGLITLSLEEFYPSGERVLIDIKDQLWEGIALKEKDFRTFIETNNWQQYTNKYVAITCSADAVIPTWAYMLLASSLQPFVRRVVYGSIDQLNVILCLELVNKIDLNKYKDARVVIKGCGDIPIPETVFIEIVSILKPVVKSIMYGEPCSTVPVYKRK